MRRRSRSSRRSYTDAQLADADFLRTELKKFGVNTSAPQFLNAGLGTLQLVLFEETAESQLWEPTFIVDYPVEVSPLARASDTVPGITERFELFITRPRDRQRFLRNSTMPRIRPTASASRSEQKDAGDEEAMYFDADYIRALEYGMPPDGWLRHRHRPSGDAADRQPQHPRRHPVPAPAPRRLIAVPRRST